MDITDLINLALATIIWHHLASKVGLEGKVAIQPKFKGKRR
jgi:hypothetical protein